MYFFCVEELVWSVTRPRTGVERPSPTRGALKTRGGCRASIAHAWSPKNGGWVQSVHRPRVEP